MFVCSILGIYKYVKIGHLQFILFRGIPFLRYKNFEILLLFPTVN